ncbi:MAG: CYTH domain-containing protein [Pseudomonadota bacterium]|nr:CYTH domain-containing protein [Pseudomonadota bacterium]
MALEVERKFLVRDDSWRTLPDGTEVEGVPFRQGYLPTADLTTVRVRLEGTRARLTIKSKNQGLTRQEYEYAIPQQDANEMLDRLCRQPQIEKTRYYRRENGLLWEIDVFAGPNAGLVLAEVELEHPDQEVRLPPWVGREVSDDSRYFNVNLARHPYSEWSRS